MNVTRSRLSRLWLALPLAALLGCGILTAFTADLAPHEQQAAILVGIALVAWHSFWVHAHPHWLEARLLPMALYFIGLLLLTDYLVGLSATFFPLYLACYPMAFVALPGAWAYAGVGATALVSQFGPPWGSWNAEGAVIEFGAAVLVSVAGGAIRALEAETARRRSAMIDLARARDEVQHALTKNIALQERVVAEARDSGALSERARLAAEIHDTLAAGLAGIVSQLEALDAQLSPDDPVRARVRMSSELARDSLQEARRSVLALRPGPLSDTSLPDALETAVTRFEASHTTCVTFCVTGDIHPVHPLVEDVLLRSAGEALANADRHARATSLHVTLSFFDTAVALDVADDGVGFRPKEISPDEISPDEVSLTEITGGQGLSIMRERAQAIGGRVSVDTSQTGGTTVTVVVPFVPHGNLRSVPE